MDTVRHWAVAAAVTLLAGCAVTPVADRAPPWEDHAFGYEASLVQVGKAELFALDAQLEREAQALGLQRLGSSQRLDAMMQWIYGADRARFHYLAGHSTGAAQTWRQRRGDCLSLTILTYAVARSLGLDAQMQEVRVPAMYDRRNGFDYVNRHVNLVVGVLNRDPLVEVLQRQEIAIDFEPEYGTHLRGKPLTEDAVLARFYNNVGVEHLARGDRRGAYAHFKAAMLADRSYSAPYGNLALLYRENKLDAPAEQLLRQAIALAEEPEVPMSALHRLLVDQGRVAEAQAFAQRLRTRQEGDPYWWISQGIRHLADGEPRKAVVALQQAQRITSGFGEVHRFLALAYWQLGERSQADEQLALLTEVDPNNVGAAKLRRKFRTP